MLYGHTVVLFDAALFMLTIDETHTPPLQAGATGARHSRQRPLRVVYAGINGVFHPSDSLYRLLFDKSCWDQGHKEYEGVGCLERALAPWPDARLVLTSTQVWHAGLDAVLEHLGAALAGRVIGATFTDLTKVAKLGAQGQPLSSNAYWSMTRSEVVRCHVDWLKPDAWIAVDDDAALWTTDERRGHCVLTDPAKGLLEPAAQDRLLTLLYGNFGEVTPTSLAVAA